MKEMLPLTIYYYSSGTGIKVCPVLAVSSGDLTDEMIQQYIEEQEGEPVTDDSRFQIDPS